MNDYTNYYSTNYSTDLESVKQFLATYSSNYFLATKLFPVDMREATFIYYAFVRYADELVDNPLSNIPGRTHATINEFRNDWKKITETLRCDENTHPVLRSFFFLCQKYDIPLSYSFDFLEVMILDLDKERYITYEELDSYMWGSAVVVGLTMSHIIGYSDTIALKHAQALGEAMQLTNFVRDIDEDYQGRARIYIPYEYMEQYNVTEKMIAQRVMTDELRDLIKLLVTKSELLFQDGMAGIRHLHPSGRISVLAAARIYRENLRILKKRNYNIFGPSIRVSTSKKLWLILTSAISHLIRLYR